MADHHLGVILDELENLGLENDTLVLFGADHGYSLGEGTLYAKHTNFETSTHGMYIIEKVLQPSYTDGMCSSLHVLPYLEFDGALCQCRIGASTPFSFLLRTVNTVLQFL